MDENVKPVEADRVDGSLSTDAAGTSAPAATDAGQQADASPAVQPAGG